MSIRLCECLMFAVVLAGVSVSGAASPPRADEPARPSFEQARAGYTYQFPRDHGSHETFQTEWWYVTGHLRGAGGERFGYELTFFRRAVDNAAVWASASRWAIRQLYLAHFAVTDIDGRQFRYTEKVSRAGLGKAGARTGALHTWIDDWSVEAQDDAHRRFRLHATGDECSIRLTVDTPRPPIVHGRDGISRKGGGDDHASHYYSFTRLDTRGSLTFENQTFDVTGTSWMDHEFGSSDLAPEIVGWDWFSVQLESGHDLMVYWLRRADGTFDAASSGTLVFPDGTSRHLQRETVDLKVDKTWNSPASGARYPSEWRLIVRSPEIQLHVTPVLADQELRTTRSTQVTYWEGAVDIEGTFERKPAKGKGYVELTGYAAPYQPGAVRHD